MPATHPKENDVNVIATVARVPGKPQFKVVENHETRAAAQAHAEKLRAGGFDVRVTVRSTFDVDSAV